MPVGSRSPNQGIPAMILSTDVMYPCSLVQISGRSDSNSTSKVTPTWVAPIQSLNSIPRRRKTVSAEGSCSLSTSCDLMEAAGGRICERCDTVSICGMVVSIGMRPLLYCFTIPLAQNSYCRAYIKFPLALANGSSLGSDTAVFSKGELLTKYHI